MKKLKCESCDYSFL